MTKKELVKRNIGVTFDFLRYLIDHPTLIDLIPNQAELDFIDKDFPLRLEKNTTKNKIIRYRVEHIFQPIQENQAVNK
jgi:hypothetical protein